MTTEKEPITIGLQPEYHCTVLIGSTVLLVSALAIGLQPKYHCLS